MNLIIGICVTWTVRGVDFTNSNKLAIEYIELNKTRQCIAVGQSSENRPILLYLHGGPGDAALALVEKYNMNLQKHFTLVVWEQRGAGKSYYPFSDEEKISIDLFVSDLHELVQMLLRRFQTQKLYLLGHSWGSVLGLTFAKRFPQLLYAYIGCGQVVNMIKSSEIAYNYALQKNIELGNKKIVDKLATIDCTYKSPTWLSDLLFVTKQIVKLGASIYGKNNMNRFTSDFIFSNYGITSLINRQKGSLQSIQFLWHELMSIDFEPKVEYSVPVYFIEGRHDLHVSSQLAFEYFQSIQTEKAYYWFENSGHFPQWEEPEHFCEILAKIKDKV